MARLIDLEPVLEVSKLTGFGTPADLIEFLKMQPTIDPVKHGKWIKTFRYMGKNFNTGEVIPVNSYDCSECGYHTGNQGRKFNYCPNCGARMGGEPE